MELEKFKSSSPDHSQILLGALTPKLHSNRKDVKNAKENNQFQKHLLYPDGVSTTSLNHLFFLRTGAAVMNLKAAVNYRKDAKKFE